MTDETDKPKGPPALKLVDNVVEIGKKKEKETEQANAMAMETLRRHEANQMHVARVQIDAAYEVNTNAISAQIYMAFMDSLTGYNMEPAERAASKMNFFSRDEALKIITATISKSSVNIGGQIEQ